MTAYPKLAAEPFPEYKGRVIVRERDLGLCVKCRRGTVMHWDHRKNRSQSGTWAPSNGQLLCVTCHQWKNDHPHQALLMGYAVPSWARPEEFPAARWFPTEWGTVQPGWCLYGDDGSVTEIPHGQAQLRMRGDWPGVSMYEGQAG